MHLATWLRATRRRAAGRARPPGPPRRRLLLLGRLRAQRRGQALVEFALLLPVFLLLLVIAVDFGRLFFSYVQIHNAAREAAAYGIYEPTNTILIASHAQAEKNSQTQRGEGAITVTTSCADSFGTTIACSLADGGAGAGNTITVNVNQPFAFFTPLINGFFGSNLQMNASATATVLGYAASAGGSNPGGCSLPHADFVWVVTSGRTIFANPSTSTPNSGICNISGYNWTWGDGTTDVGTATGDSHMYLAGGSYTVRLEVTNQAGPDFQTQTILISTAPPPPTCAKPNANFTWTKAGKTYTYRDASTVADPVNCPITDWLWTFTDDGGLQSNAQNPTPVTYGNNSAHPVTLKVTNLGGSTTITLST